MIYLLGDVHGSIDHLLPLIEAQRPEALIFLGDIESPVDFGRYVSELEAISPVWWIPGNHDTDRLASFANLFGSRLAERNLHGRVVDIAGVRVAGLGGVFRSRIWAPPDAPVFASYEEMVAAKYRHRRDLPVAELMRCRRDATPGLAALAAEGQLRLHLSSIFHDDWQRLATQRADILVTHEAPSCHPHGFAEIDVLARSLGARWLFHGHHHDDLDYMSASGGNGFRAFGVGFRGVTDQSGNRIIAGGISRASAVDAGSR